MLHHRLQENTSGQPKKFGQYSPLYRFSSTWLQSLVATAKYLFTNELNLNKLQKSIA